MFLRLLEACLRKPVDELFLVGDIFDLWISDRRYFVESYSAIVEKLRRLKVQGTRIHYFEGNHDLDLRPFWQHRLGFDVHSEAAFFMLNGVSYRVEHGDQMDPDDRGYLFLRWLLRTPVIVFLARWLPDRLVSWIGQRSSAASRDYTTQIKVASDRDVVAKIHTHVSKVFAQNPFAVLVSGHVHVPDDSQLSVAGQTVRSVNMGTWLKKPLVFDVHGGTGELKDVEAFITGP